MGFFILALLIVETFLTLVLTINGGDYRFGIYIGSGLFVLVVVIVAIIDWFRPHHLMFGEKAHLMDRGKFPYGTSEEVLGKEEILGKRERQISKSKGKDEKEQE